jgi:uncharacterized protein (DUF362 family)
MQTRRRFLKATSAAVVGAAVGCRSQPPKFDAAAGRRPDRSRVAVIDAADYGVDLVDPIRRGIDAFGLQPRGKRVVLKPNIVEFDPEGVINTHPHVIAAAVEAFLGLGAAEVVVAEGPGHRRDNEYLLTASGMIDVLRERRVRYVDLNFDAVRSVRLGSRFTQLGHLYLPATVLDADLFVSMPKLKTHHWAGVTLSMKNLFGIVPSAIYGWPKNVLHWAGLEGSIVDINSSLSMPRFAIVDGIVGMEGDGPIRGEAKHAGVLVVGEDLVAVDATCARLMQINPAAVQHLAWAGQFLGNADGDRIEQIGEEVARRQQDFRVLSRFDFLKV